MKTFVVKLTRVDTEEPRVRVIWGKARKRRQAVKAAKRIHKLTYGGKWRTHEVYCAIDPLAEDFKSKVRSAWHYARAVQYLRYSVDIDHTTEEKIRANFHGYSGPIRLSRTQRETLGKST